MSVKQRRIALFVVALAIAGVLVETALSRDSKDANCPVLRVVYFVPADRKAEPNYAERLERVMSELQGFYREGMKRNGYGEMTFELDREADQKLRIFTVQGKEPMRGYDRKSGDKARDKIRQEVKDALAKEGLDFEQETAVIFQVLLEWQGNKLVEIGPFSGGGHAHKGSALVFDEARLDPKLLTSKQPGGYHLKPCSLGEFNTHSIGGIAHELGHAFGLSHERERPSEQARKGWSIMGSGNRHYGNELRGEGRGAFLSAAAAFPLSLHPHFTGKRTPTIKLTCEMAELTATPLKGKLSLAGRLQGGPRAVGLVAYSDPQDKADAYDAQGWPAPVDADGKFQVLLEELQPAKNYGLLFRVYADSGDMKELRFHFDVDKEGRPDVSTLSISSQWPKALVAFRAKDQTSLAEIAEAVKKQTPRNDVLVRKIGQLQKLATAVGEKEKLQVAATLPASVKSVKVADLEWESASIGWGNPLRNQVPAEREASVLLEVDGAFFDSGLYAHAPARHAIRVDRKWKSFTTKFGLQDGRSGSVVFVVKGDGKELFRSKPLRDHSVQQQSVNIASANLLELMVEDAGDGAKADWGVWLAPELRR